MKMGQGLTVRPRLEDEDYNSSWEKLKGDFQRPLGHAVIGRFYAD